MQRSNDKLPVMKILTVSTMKGGVGKSATCHALGEALSTDYKVLLIDIDPQSTLTLSCNATSDNNIVDVMRESSTLDAVTVELTSTLSIIPSDIELATVELALVEVMGRESVLKRSLVKMKHQYDIVIIDTPPSLGLLTVNALVAADGVLIPTQPQIADLRGLSLFKRTLDRVSERLNPELEIVGVLVTMFNSRTTHHKEAIDVLKGSGLPLLDTIIGRSVRVAEASASYQSIVTYEPNNPRASEYLQLAEHVKQWLRRKAK